MLKKRSAMHIIDACDRILFDEEDARVIHFMLENSSESQVNRCYRAYIREITRQCKGKY